MIISKTAFKEYSRCKRVYPLEQIYLNKLNNEVSFYNNENVNNNLEILSQMFDVDSGDDLIMHDNQQMDILLPFYKNVEKWAIKLASQIFNTEIEYHDNTNEQKYFSFKDKSFHSFYCYLDGYKELGNQVLVFEVKATTSKKFSDFGPKRKQPQYNSLYNSIFEKQNNIYTIKKELDDELTYDKFSTYYRRLFDRYSDIGKYIFDIAIERYIIENSLNDQPQLKSKKFKYYLAVLNSDYIFDGKYVNGEPDFSLRSDNESLINFIDVTSVTKEYMPIIERIKENIVSTIYENAMINPIIDNYCEISKQTKCLFHNICWKKLYDKGSILEYMSLKFFYDSMNNKMNKYSLINQGKIKMKDIPHSWLNNNNHIIQRRCLDNNEIYINRNKMIKALELIEYPIYYLDFESFPCPLPRFSGEKPYSQSLFQFSIHIDKEKGKCDEINDHVSFLVNDFYDHRLELVEKLVEIIDLNNGGTVLVYNMNFEYNRIKELINIFPEYKQKLEKILIHMFDLMDIIKTNKTLYQKLGFNEEDSKTINYYHNDLSGLYSIKKVLPLFSNLSYSNLSVKNGNEAIMTYASFKNLPMEDINILRNKLIEYCRQDTWAMVVILRNIYKLISRK